MSEPTPFDQWWEEQDVLRLKGREELYAMAHHWASQGYARGLVMGKNLARQWVPVSERLPAEEGQYIIFAPSADPAMPLLISTWWHGDHWGLVDVWAKAVTHWMPMPPMPEVPK